MGLADRTQYLVSHHAVAGVAFLADVIGVDRLEIAGPSATGVEFGVGRKQRGAAAYAAIDAGFAGIPIAPGEGPFGVFQSRDSEFLGAEGFAPMSVGLGGLIHGGA